MDKHSRTRLYAFARSGEEMLVAHTNLALFGRSKILVKREKADLSLVIRFQKLPKIRLDRS